MPTAIQAECLSKRYRLGVIGGGTLRDDVNRWFAMIRGRSEPLNQVGTGTTTAVSGEEIWALRDVSFEVAEGEILGIIGRNGAGKSTLLKILSRITAPTSGRATLRGRVGSLLEVGTGFHPELTGRENIYLNGTILGMTKVEVDHKLDEIVAFAEMAPFIDTPVKRYSSGMKVRLAFAVAAHLEPEILIVDEVLAVGDAAFQEKCLGRLKTVSTGGRTVLFVSHNLGALSRLCKKSLWLKNGRLVASGETTKLVREYVGESTNLAGAALQSDGSDGHLRSVEVLSEAGGSERIVDYCSSLLFRIFYVGLHGPNRHVLVVRVSTRDGVDIFTSWDIDAIETSRPSSGVATCRVPSRLLRPGDYVATTMVHEVTHSTPVNKEEKRFEFRVTDIGYTMNPGRVGVITPTLEWDYEPVAADTLTPRTPR